MSVNDRIGAYWAISALCFAVLFLIALIRFWGDWSRPRASILAFTGSWFALCAVLAEMRFNALSIETPIATGHAAEGVRIAAVVTLIGVLVEWVVAPSLVIWDGKRERRIGPADRRTG